MNKEFTINNIISGTRGPDTNALNKDIVFSNTHLRFQAYVSSINFPLILPFRSNKNEFFTKFNYIFLPRFKKELCGTSNKIKSK